MPWFKVDDDLAFHRKTVAAGNAAMGLWVRAGAWCAQTLTDGLVPTHMVSALGNAAQARKLVEVGLWVRAAGGYQFHGWGERQPTRAEVDEKRAAARERMRRARTANRSDRSDEVRANSTRTNGERSSEHDALENRDFDEISTKFDHRKPSRDQTVTSILDTVSEATTLVDDESEADVRENFAHSDANPVPTRPDPYIGGHLEGGRLVSDARASRDDSTPPKHHPGHDEYDPDCADCERTARRYERHVALALADTEPSPHCDRHPGGTLDACRDCGRARTAHTQWHEDRRHAAAVAQSEAARETAEVRRAAIDACSLCDEHGYAGARVCDHDPGSAERARRGIEAARAALAQRSSR